MGNKRRIYNRFFRLPIALVLLAIPIVMAFQNCGSPTSGKSANNSLGLGLQIAIFRPSSGTFFVGDKNGQILKSLNFGTMGDIPVPGDFNGDGQKDMAVYRPSDLTWYLTLDQTGVNPLSVIWGIANSPNDKMVPADYNGDGKTDMAVFHDADGGWFVHYSPSFDLDLSDVHFGTSGDIPVPADYNGDGKADFAVYRPSNHHFYISFDKSATGPIDVDMSGFGAPADTIAPVAADINGDGKVDIALFDQTTGAWRIHFSSANPSQTVIPDQIVSFGTSGDIPVPADYNGDGKADLALFRNGAWFVHYWQADVTQQNNNVDASIWFGTIGDKPLAPSGFRF